MENNFNKTNYILNKYNFKILKIDGDGSCLFKSLAVFLGINYTTIRFEIVNYIKSDEELKDNIKKILTTQTMESYISKMSNNNEWGGEPEIIAATRFYNREIIVITPENILLYKPNLELVCVEINQDTILKDNNSIIVYYNGVNHYDGIIKI